MSDLKVLDIPCYDMVLGMDWLATYSPMKVDWACKWLCIPYAGSHILLQEVCQHFGISVGSGRMCIH